MDPAKLLRRLAHGNIANVAFRDMRSLVEAFGFRPIQVAGNHHIYARDDVAELVNLQEVRGQAKPYQVRQFLRLVERYGLSLEER